MAIPNKSQALGIANGLGGNTVSGPFCSRLTGTIMNCNRSLLAAGTGWWMWGRYLGMESPVCLGCSERDAQIAALEAQEAELRERASNLQ